MVSSFIFNSDTAFFKDRSDGGKKLARQLASYVGNNTLVLGLPRGGIPVAYEVAKQLQLPLDVIISRKIGAPQNPELGIGAISEDDSLILDENTINLLGLTKTEVEDIITLEKEELKRRIRLYRHGQPPPSLKDKVILLIDDGLATGVTARAAINFIKKHNPKKILFAAPVCAYETTGALRSMVDSVVCFSTPHDLQAIGLYYRDFTQTSDEEIISLLNKIRKPYQAYYLNKYP